MKKQKQIFYFDDVIKETLKKSHQKKNKKTFVTKVIPKKNSKSKNFF